MIEVVVNQRRLDTPDIVVLELADATGGRLPDFVAGAHVDVVLGDALTRQYSLCRMPDADGRYEIGVLRDPQSRGGSVAAHRLEPGQALRISPPRNHFPLVPGPHLSLLFGGGIGVTPLLAMAEQLHRAGAPFALHYCARSRAAAAFLDRLAGVAWADRVFLHFDDGDAAQRLDAAAVLRAAPGDAHAYVCGPGGFIAHVRDTARSAGWPDARLHSEYFTAPDADAPQAGAAFQVRIASTGAVIDVGEDDTIAKALLRHGLAIEVSCEAGVCGACLTGVLAGCPDHRDYYLDAREKAQNDQMMLCCSRALSPLLVLDL
jgi:vanillate O-demethylase ferredoxin subunit